eukprot:scpid71863/ scgid15304/ 
MMVMIAKRAEVTPRENAARASNTIQASDGRSARARNAGSMMDRFMDTYSQACTQREEGADRRAQADRDHDADMAKRHEQHSTMLQSQLLETTACIQQNQQQCVTNNLQAIMTFQANLLKNVLGNSDKEK